ncbi:hypothetical protein PF004_g1121 [Phytophthora fragariae]|uniref:Uncharacterized protein n=1 Tax=Phytophthora fragariae TaxID=53985 RepID=A0A6G0PTQ9_9STRA|nr:hypothetical protein PF004_g1121 [Phytophthora fragariae]
MGRPQSPVFQAQSLAEKSWRRRGALTLLHVFSFSSASASASASSSGPGRLFSACYYRLACSGCRWTEAAATADPQHQALRLIQ